MKAHNADSSAGKALHAKGMANYKSNPERAAVLLQEAVDAGYLVSLFMLARLYMKGEGVEQNMPRAIELFTQAANEGCADSQYRLGRIYLHAQGAERDTATGLKYLTQAAEQDHYFAVLSLAGLYRYGFEYDNAEVVPANKTEAIRYYIKAATNDDCVISQRTLGDMYYRGEGVDKDAKEAAKWYRLALVQFCDHSTYKLALILKKQPALMPDLDSTDLIVEAAQLGNKEAFTRAKRLGFTI